MAIFSICTFCIMISQENTMSHNSTQFVIFSWYVFKPPWKILFYKRFSRKSFFLLSCRVKHMWKPHEKSHSCPSSLSEALQRAGDRTGGAGKTYGFPKMKGSILFSRHIVIFKQLWLFGGNVAHPTRYFMGASYRRLCTATGACQRLRHGSALCAVSLTRQCGTN